jgi:hypothetical protein
MGMVSGDQGDHRSALLDVDAVTTSKKNAHVAI